MKYKKYILFEFYTHGSSGGLFDITDSFDTLEEAQAFVGSRSEGYDYQQVVDRDTWEIIWETD